MRLAVPLALVALVLAACGGSSPAATDLGAARAKTTAAGTARFRLSIVANVGGQSVTADENGTISFTRRRAHLYKLVPGGALPREVVMNGPYTFTNANVDAALRDSSVKPWTKLDTRRLTAKQRKADAGELAHVRAPAYLADGVAHPKRVGREADGTTHFTGVVDPARLARRVPRAILAAVHADYAVDPFPASFWVDGGGRIRRVLVEYTTAQGTQIALDTTYSGFGAKVSLTVPRPSEIQNITP